MAFALTGCAAKAELHDAREAFVVELPPDCSLQTQRAAEDFEVFTAVCRNAPYVGIYVGNHPTPDSKARLLNTRFNWPAYVQVWSYEPAGDEARAAALAASIRVRQP